MYTILSAVFIYFSMRLSLLTAGSTCFLPRYVLPSHSISLPRHFSSPVLEVWTQSLFDLDIFSYLLQNSPETVLRVPHKYLPRLKPS